MGILKNNVKLLFNKNKQYNFKNFTRESPYGCLPFEIS